MAGALVLGLLLGWIVRGLVMQRPDTFRIVSYGDWRLTCPPRSAVNGNCQVTQDVVNRKSGTVIARVALHRANNKAEMTIAVPFNVLLPAGLKLRIGTNAPKRFAYSTCDKGGCLANIQMDDNMYDLVVAAKELRVIVSALSGKAVEINLSSRGLRDSVDAMNVAESRRHSWLRRVFL